MNWFIQGDPGWDRMVNWCISRWDACSRKCWYESEWQNQPITDTHTHTVYNVSSHDMFHFAEILSVSVTNISDVLWLINTHTHTRHWNCFTLQPTDTHSIMKTPHLVDWDQMKTAGAQSNTLNSQQWRTEKYALVSATFIYISEEIIYILSYLSILCMTPAVWLSGTWFSSSVLTSFLCHHAPRFKNLCGRLTDPITRWQAGWKSEKVSGV